MGLATTLRRAIPRSSLERQARMRLNRLRLKPVSRSWGLDRGTPLDRVYIDRYLDQSRELISGRVLEIGERVYTERFGTNVTESIIYDVIDSDDVDIVGDLATGAGLEAESYDCMLVLQTLMLVYDVRAAIDSIYQALKPGASVIATVNFLSPNGQDPCHDMWQWNFTPSAIGRLFEERFGAENVSLTPYGNYAVASCFLAGMAAQEVELDMWKHEPGYEVLIGVTATRPATTR